MKKFVTLVVVVALLGALAVSASAALEDTLILKAKVAPYAAVWFQNAGTYGTDAHSDIWHEGAEKSLDFGTITATQIGDAMVLGTGDKAAAASSKSTTLQVRTNYAVNLGINASAPKATERPAVLRTEIEIDGVTFVGGSQNGDTWDDFAALVADKTYDLYPGDAYVPVDLIKLVYTQASLSPESAIHLSAWSDAGLSIPFTVSVFPQNYRWDSPDQKYVAGEYTPAFASDTYEGSIVATISAP